MVVVKMVNLELEQTKVNLICKQIVGISVT